MKTKQENKFVFPIFCNENKARKQVCLPYIM